MIPTGSSLSVLLINEQAEESKLVSTNLRSFFPDCRIEAVYSSDEAIQWSVRSDWHLILVDENLSPRGGVDILQELKRACPYAAIILQTDRSDSTSALHALQQGADFLLFKSSPGFITELLFYTQEAIEKRELQVKLDLTFQRHLRLVEAVSDVVYELDHEGRFVYLSPTVTPLLGYTPEELAGKHFSMLLPPTQETPAKYRINERRAGARSTFHLELPLLGKPSVPDKDRKILMQVTAKGLYDTRHRYMGTVGLLHDLSHEQEQSGKLLELETRLQEAGRQLAVSEQASSASRNLQQPLSALLQDSHQLLTTIQNIRIEQHLERLTLHATRASELGQELSQALQLRHPNADLISLNTQIQDAVASLVQEQMIEDDSILREFSEDLPLMVGVSRRLRDMFRILIMYARQPVGTQAMRRPLIIHTHVLIMHHASDSASSSIFSLSPMTQYIVATIREGDPDPFSGPAKPSAQQITGSDFLQAHRIIQEHSGVIEIASSSLLPVQITVRFPAVGTPRPSTPNPKEESTTHAAEVHVPARSPSADPTDVRSDRRRFPRTTLALAIDLSVGTMLLQGTVLNIGLGGLFFVSRQVISTVEDHPVYLVLRTPVSFLELHGIAHQRSTSFSEQHPTCLAITFTSLNDLDCAVLASLIQEIHEHSSSVQIEGLIPQDSLTESHSAVSNSLQAEQRWHVRAKLAIPVYLTRSDSGRETDCHIGLLVNLGKGGACVQTRIQTNDVPSRLFIRNMEANHATHKRPLTDDDVFDRPVACRVIWKTALTRRPHEPLSNPLDKNWQIGIQFGHLSNESEERLNRFLFSRLLSLSDLDHRTERGTVRSTTHRPRNREGHPLVVSQDFAKGLTETHTPVLIISPGYGQSKIDYLNLAHVLALNGFRVLRYDPTHALGLSEGTPHLMTLSGMQQDLATIREFVRETWPTAPVSVMASDLSARAALKFFANHEGADHLLLLNPVLDVSDTLARTHQHDLLGEHKAGIRRGITNMLGRNTDIDHFLVDALVEGYTDLESTVQDLNRVRSKVSFLLFPTGDDVLHDTPWTEPRFIEQAQGILGDRSMTLNLSSAVVGDGPVSAEAYRRTLETIVSHCKQITMSAAPVHKAFREPDAGELRSHHRVELEQLRTKQHATRATRLSLWTELVRSGPMISEAPSYLQHFDHMYQFAHPTTDHSTLLDVGCGHNGFARLLLLNHFYRSRSQRYSQDQRIDYVGIDAQEDIVLATRNTLRSVQRHVDIVYSGSISGRPLLSPRWLLADIDDPLPFAEQTFDRVVCHFTLNFSHNPLISLREFYRVLRPRGQFIMSCFTSFTDLAPAYRQHLRDMIQDEFHPDSQEVLQALALLHESLRSRRLHTFSSKSLSDLFALLTTTPLLTFPTLHGQILIATVEKPDSAS